MLHPSILVVPVDFSPFAEGAFRYAAALARRGGAALHLLHVHPPEPDPQADTPTKNALLALAERAGVEQGAVTLVQRHAERPSDTVVRYADEVGADLVVMSRHGGRGLRRLLLGSQTDAVLRTAPCPVLVLPTGGDPVPPRRLLVPVDLTAGSAPLLADARAFAVRYGDDARLDVLYALAPLPYPTAWLGEAAYELMPDLQAQAEAELEAFAARAGGPAVPTLVHVEHGPPAAVILRAAETLRADLIVMASHGASALDRALLGSVTERVVRAADRPVLVLRGHG